MATRGCSSSTSRCAAGRNSCFTPYAVPPPSWRRRPSPPSPWWRLPRRRPPPPTPASPRSRCSTWLATGPSRIVDDLVSTNGDDAPATTTRADRRCSARPRRARWPRRVGRQHQRGASLGTVDEYTAPGYGTLADAGATAKATCTRRRPRATTLSTRRTWQRRARGDRARVPRPDLSGRSRTPSSPAMSSLRDYANTIGQAFAAMTLRPVEQRPRPAAVTGFLLEQQCAAGYFRQDFAATGDDQTCDGGHARSGRRRDRASPSVALIGQADDANVDADIAVGRRLVAERPAVPTARCGRRRHRQAATPTAPAWPARRSALGCGSRQPPSVRHLATARDQLTNAGLQALPDCATPMPRARPAAVTSPGQGADRHRVDQCRRATAQALPALQWAPAGTGTNVRFTPAYVRAGTKPRVSVTGAAPGEALCTTPGGQKCATHASSTGTAQFTVALPHEDRRRPIVTVSKALGRRRQGHDPVPRREAAAGRGQGGQDPQGQGPGRPGQRPRGRGVRPRSGCSARSSAATRPTPGVFRRIGPGRPASPAR